MVNIVTKANKIIADKLITVEYESENFVGYNVANVIIRYCKRTNTTNCFCLYHCLKDTEQVKECSYTWALKLWRKKNENCNK